MLFSSNVNKRPLNCIITVINLYCSSLNIAIFDVQVAVHRDKFL